MLPRNILLLFCLCTLLSVSALDVGATPRRFGNARTLSEVEVSKGLNEENQEHRDTVGSGPHKRIVKKNRFVDHPLVKKMTSGIKRFHKRFGGRVTRSPTMQNQVDQDRVKKDLHDFIIVSEDRSGTRFTVDELNKNPQVDCKLELMGKAGGGRPGTWQHSQSVLDKRFGHQRINKAVGFKWMWHQHLLDHVSELEKALKFYDLRIVIIWRKNMLRQKISLEAMTLGRKEFKMNMDEVAHPHSEKTMAKVSSVKPTIKASGLVQKFDMKKAMREKIEKFFHEHLPEGYLKVKYYEEILEDSNKFVQDIESFLGVNVSLTRNHTAETNPIHLGKQLSELITNPDEVTNVLKDSEYKDFLDL